MYEMPQRPVGKQEKDDKKIPAGLFVLLVIVVIVLLAILFFFVTQKPSSPVEPAVIPQSTSADNINSSEVLDPFEFTPVPRDEGNIIISSVEYEEGNIAYVSMILPDKLAGKELYVSDSLVEYAVENGDEIIIYIDLPASLQSQEVDFIFRDGESQVASCSISMNDVSNPVGDCGW